MIEALVSAVTAALSRPSVLAFAAAAFWGLCSVFLSPCHLGSIPLLVAYVNNGERAKRSRAFAYSSLFALGLLVTLAAIGVITSLAGRLLGNIGIVPRIIVAVFLVFCGLWLMDVPPLNRISLAMNVSPKRRGAWGALILGLVYGIALGPCSFAFLAPMLGFVFAASSSDWAFGAALMAFYAFGHTAAIVVAGTLGDRIGAYLSKRGEGKAGLWFKRICGALVIVAGIYQLFV